MLRVVALVFALSAGHPTGPSLAAATPLQFEALVAVQEAQSLLAAGNSAAALELAEHVVARAPFNVEAHHVIQRVYRLRGNSAGLISRYRGLAARYPGTAAAQYLLGNVLLSVESFRTARPYFDRALELDPRFGWAASINAILNQYDGNVSEALRLGRISAEEITNDVLTAAVYADLLRMNGLREEAIRFLQTAAALNPSEPGFLVELWKLWTRGVDDVEGARAQFAAQFAANRGRFLDTPEHAAMLARFLAGAAMADRDASRETWLALADRFPDTARAKDALLRAASMTTDLDDKIDLYNRILDEYPDSPIRYAVYERLIRDLIRREEYDRAKRTARGLTTEPDPGRGDADHLGRNEGPTAWGYTLEGIGYAGWFAAAQAEAGAKNVGWYNIRLGERRRREQPSTPQALVAARALDSSGSQDPK
ncbi:MAG: tetratricopeptide repeat protein, partial [Acidobacteria bacterium]|nr:tetratricopeptide repeat protein [Acidobacteriota bacterium]